MAWISVSSCVPKRLSFEVCFPLHFPGVCTENLIPRIKSRISLPLVFSLHDWTERAYPSFKYVFLPSSRYFLLFSRSCPLHADSGLSTKAEIDFIMFGR